MPSKDVIPEQDVQFDIQQDNLVSKVTTNAVAWGIPAGEITKLTDKQAIWTPAWNAVKVKQNATQAQREAKDIARHNYEKVLRPFIQKWIYRNENMDNADIEECGLRPRDTTPTDKPAPDTPADIQVKRGGSGELLPECGKVEFAESYGCIMMAGIPLPAFITLTPAGQLVVLNESGSPGPGPGSGVPGQVLIAVDLTKKRKKKFTGLTPGVDYYFYFYTLNAAGASPLSAPVVMKCPY